MYHQIINELSCNIGETQLEQTGKFYSIIHKLNYMFYYTPQAQKTFIK